MDADDLYGLALEQFIPERGALAKALRADKRRKEAAAVAALRKPSGAAWAVNQLVRSQLASVQALFAAGDELRDAQARLLAGSGDGRALRAANERERAAVAELVDAARGLLSSDGHELSDAVLERVADTLHAAALDEDAREQVREGRLERELRHVGLGLGESADPLSDGSAMPAAPKQRAAKPPAVKPGGGTGKARGAAAAKAPATTGAPAKPSAEERGGAREQAKRDREERERRERERSEARKAGRIAEAAAKRRAERAGHALKAAEERRERAANALEQADEALAAAQAEALDALAAHEQAQAELDAL